MQNKPSELLTNDENQILFQALGSKCKVVLARVRAREIAQRESLFADDGDDGRTAVHHPAADALDVDQEGDRGPVLHQGQRKKKLLLPLVLFQEERLHLGARDLLQHGVQRNVPVLAQFRRRRKLHSLVRR